tara:strand:+ start:91 stop:279 length:189 start_codon:yes stop_codon:yes gene_type:complete
LKLKEENNDLKAELSTLRGEYDAMAEWIQVRFEKVLGIDNHDAMFQEQGREWIQVKENADIF